MCREKIGLVLQNLIIHCWHDGQEVLFLILKRRSCYVVKLVNDINCLGKIVRLQNSEEAWH